MIYKYPSISIAIGLVVGILTGELFEAYFMHSYAYVFLALAIVSVSAFKKASAIQKIFAIFILSAFLGFILKSYSNLTYLKSLPASENISNARLYAKVYKIDRLKENSFKIYVKADSIKWKQSIFKNEFYCLAHVRDNNLIDLAKFYDKLKVGNEIWAYGEFTLPQEKTSPADFDYANFLKRKRVVGIFRVTSLDNIAITDYRYNFFESFVNETRKIIEKQVQKVFEPKTASLMKGFILGDRSEIDEESVEDFVKTGIVHILAVSGLHVGYIFLIVSFFFGRLNIFYRSLFIIISLILFIFISGQAASIVRAVTMASLAIIAKLLNRDANLFNLLSITAIAILLVDSEQIFNPGFQLSFAAVLSIGIFFPYLNDKIKALNIKNDFARYVLLFIGLTISAQAGALPFILSYFQTVSLISIIANIIAIPLAGLILASGIVALLISTLSDHIALIAAETATFLSNCLFLFAELSASIPYGYFKVYGFSTYDVFVYLIFVSLFVIFFGKLSNFKIKLIFALTVIANMFLYFSFDDNIIHPQKNYAIILSSRYNDAVLLKNTKNQYCLIGSPTKLFLESNVSNFIKKFNGDKLSFCIFTDVNDNTLESAKYLFKEDLCDTLFIPYYAKKFSEDSLTSLSNAKSFQIQTKKGVKFIRLCERLKINFDKDLVIESLFKAFPGDNKIAIIKIRSDNYNLLNYFYSNAEGRKTERILNEAKTFGIGAINLFCFSSLGLDMLRNLKIESNDIFLTSDNKIRLWKKNYALNESDLSKHLLEKTKIYEISTNRIKEVIWK